MGTLIDSSVLLAAERAHVDLDHLLGDHGDEQVAIAAITASELLHGVHRAATPAQRARREAFVETLLSLLPVVPFDLLVARTHARLWAQLATKGTVIGAHDLVIAATALSLDYAVATHDRRSFPKIPGVRIVEW
jgi:predicted nucleic acid-binding protein